jgi:hypothetical protein
MGELSMKNKPVSPDARVKGQVNPKIASGLSVRTNLQAGNWRCTACEGQAMGSSLYKSNCEYCERA